MDEAIVNYIRKNHNLLVGDTTAEKVKKEIGAATIPRNDTGRVLSIKGRDLVNGVPKEIKITESQIVESLVEPVSAVVEAVKFALENTPPELSADIVDRGIIMTGGGSLLNRLDELLREKTGLPVAVAEDPMSCVALGAGKTLEELEIMKNVLLRIS
jgi:rod shape-determining protein MreB